MENLNRKKAFTLIELLVVVAIIALLATIVIANVTSTKNKAKDNSIKTMMNGLRGSAELYANQSGGSYAGFCSVNCAGGNADWQRVCNAVSTKGGSLSCNVSATAWCATSSLNISGTYCVDSKAHGAAEPGNIACSGTICP